MKLCPKCNLNLPDSAFNKSSRAKSGLRSYCRKCDHAAYRKYANSPQGKATNKAYKQSKKGKEIYRKSDRKRNKTEHRRQYKRRQMRQPEYRKLKNDWLNEYRSKPEAQPALMAGRQLRYAIRIGTIKRGPCELTHTKECFGKPQGHHDDYSKPLDVRWLCPRHHTMFHRG